MYKLLIYLISTFLLIACTSDKQQADFIVTNANIYTVDDALPKAQAFAIKDGLFIGVGSSKEINNQFTSKEILNLKGKTIVPGLIDGHCHFNDLGFFMQQVDL